LAVLISEGLNHNFRASLALLIASSSVSPAEAQPGSSGKTADHRFVRGSNSTRRRNFMATNIAHERAGRKSLCSQVFAAGADWGQN